MRAAAAWARAEVRGRAGGLVAVALLVGLLAAAAMTAVAGGRRTSTSFDRFRDTTLAQDVMATIDAPEQRRLEQVGRLPGVAAGVTGSLFVAFVDIESSFDMGIIAPSHRGLGTTIARGRYLSGRPPREDSAEEVALNERAAETLDAEAGDRIVLGTLSAAQIANINQEFSGRLEGPELRLRVSGIVRQPDDLQSDEASVLLFATPAFERAHRDDVGRFAAFGLYLLEGGTAAFGEFAREARPILGTEGEVSLTSAADLGASVGDALHAIALALYLIAAAAGAVALVAGGQALARQLTAGAADQQVLNALGLTWRQRSGGVTLVAVPVALGAAVVALGAAVLASPLMPISLGRQAEPAPGIAFDPLVHLGGAAGVFVLVALGGAFVGAVVARRSRTTEGPPVRPALATRIGAALHLGASASTGVRMALEPGSGRTAVPVRSALTGAVLAVAGLVGALTFGASLDRLVSTPARFGLPWDFQPDLFEEAELPASVRKDAASAGILYRSTVEVEELGATAYAIQRVQGSPTFEYLGGRPPATDDEVALGRDLLRRLGRRVGDTVRLATPTGGERTMRVVGTVVMPGLDQDPIAGGVALTVSGLEAVRQSDAAGVQTLIWWREGVDPKAAVARYHEAFPESVSAYSTPRPAGEIVNLRRVRTLPNVFAGFVGLVGVAALVHAVATSTRRRRHDLAVLRSLGFLRRQVAAAVAWQSSTIGIVGLVLGVPLGLVLGRWAWILVSDGMGVATDPLLPVAAVLLVIPATIALVNLLGAPLGARAARQPAAAILRTE